MKKILAPRMCKSTIEKNLLIYDSYWNVKNKHRCILYAPKED